MKRRDFILAAGALAAPLQAAGQASLPRVGVIYYGDTYEPVIEGLRIGLKELGVVEGRHVTLDVRNGRGDARLIEEAARGFEREKAALLFAVPTTAMRIVQRATSAIPVVFCVGTDPITSGFVASYAKPGGRFTGVHYLNSDLTAKRLELLKDMLPKMRRVVSFYLADNPVAISSARLARDASKRLDIQFIERPVRSEHELLAAIAALRHSDADAIFYVADAFMQSHTDLVLARAKAIRMPTMSYALSVVERGALVSYGVDTREVGRQSARYVQRVLSGARTADLPVENATRLVFALNRHTAKEIGVEIPPAMIVRFDRVIE